MGELEASGIFQILQIFTISKLLKELKELRDSTFCIHFTNIPLLHWHSISKMALHFYGGIVADAALKWHITPQWLVLSCISTVAYHFYSDTPPLHWHAT
jgi:hypothetical protein